MSRYELRATCSTGDNFQDLLQAQAPSLLVQKPEDLVVFVGDRAAGNDKVSIMAASGGLYARQLFTWQNLAKIGTMDRTKLFLDYQSISVTLSVDLEPTTDPSLTYGNAGSTIPTGALAVNLGSKGFQFNTSNMINEDIWGKLVYYEQGGLGIGWAFSANDYFTQSNANAVTGLGMYMTGGLLPDVSYNVMGNATSSFQYLSATPIYNMQVGRDQALLTQMMMTDEVRGPQGYWSVQPVNFDPSVGTVGRRGGTLYRGNTATSEPVFNSYNPFGFMFLSYPTALQIPNSASPVPQGWNNLYPSYAPSTMDGYMMSGNAIPVTPGSFFTEQGLQLLKSSDSNPSNPVIEKKLWTDYWQNATSVVHLEETRPLYIEAPLFHLPMSMDLIPNFSNGLMMLVPITRICNGVYMYVPIDTGTDVNSDGLTTIKMNGQTITDTNYFPNSMGTLQKWFTPRKVSLTINMPFVRLDTAIQASRFFNTVAASSNYTVKCPVWIKKAYTPKFRPNGSVVDPLNPSTTATLTEIYSASGEEGGMYFLFTAREILNHINEVLQTHRIPTGAGWGVNELVIRQILVSCTPVLDVPRVYSTLLGLPSFQGSPQGAIVAKGGMKMFSRCGPSLSQGPPDEMSIEFTEVVSNYSIGQDTEDGGMYFDVSKLTGRSRGAQNNDYFTGTSSFVFSNRISLRVPQFVGTDSGGAVQINVCPRPVLNLPFSGEVFQKPSMGGVMLANADVKNGALTTTNLASYAPGWFNNLNPFSPDYNPKYAYNNAASELDNMSYLDYKMVDFNARKVEIWICVEIPVKIYSGLPYQ